MRAARAWALLALAALAAGCGLTGETAGPAAGSMTVEATRMPLRIVVPAKGELAATSASPVAVPRVPTGALKVKDLVPEGTIVEPGEVVVVFDDTELNVELDNHRASFRSAERRIDRTGLQSVIEGGSIEVMREVAELERDNVREFEIVDTEIYSRQEILEDEVRLETAEETILFADASLLLRGEYYDIDKRILEVEKGQHQGKLERVQFSLGNLVLHAPIGGLIAYKKNWRGSTVAVGDSLWPGNVIMSIVDPGSCELQAFVLERDAAGVAVGADASVRVDARPDREFRGRVRSVAELSRPIESGSPVKYTEVRIEILDGDPKLLLPGMKGEGRILAGQVEEALVIPRSTLRGNPQAPYVLVRGPAGVERRDVTLGPGDLVRVAVENGLAEGERVLLGDAPQETAPAEPIETARATPPAGA